MGLLLTSSEAAGSSTGTVFATIVIYALVILVFYLIIFRPQKKQQKEHAAMVAAMEVGDCVMTTSGFYGVIINITDDTVIVEFGSNKNCRIPMDKSAISKIEKSGENA